MKVAAIKYRGQGIGEAAIEAHSTGETVYVTANSTLVGAKVDATGQVALTGDYPAQAKLTVAGFECSLTSLLLSARRRTRTRVFACCLTVSTIQQYSLVNCVHFVGKIRRISAGARSAIGGAAKKPFRMTTPHSAFRDFFGAACLAARASCSSSTP